MLRRAREYAGAQMLDLELLTDDELFATSRTFDLVTCVFVLQHLTAAAARDAIHSLTRHVALGGYLHLQFPYRTHRPALSRASLAARQWIPGANRLANAARRRAADVPLLVPHVHAIDDIVSELNALHCSVLQFDVARENELETAHLTGVRGMGAEPRVTRTPEPADAPPPPDFIDVQELMRNTPLDEWNRRAEEYFAGLTKYDEQLAKPFSSPGDAPMLLVNAGIALQALRALPGMTVLDFGAGTGWLTRALSQLGCRVISVDVSQTALDIARGDLESRPMVGNAPFPTFLRFDGRRLELADESVDRVICFDSFHHVPNPDDVLREFARILKPGGLAAFSEPGPRHSRSPQSQFEMRTYGVLENDIDLHAIWPIAREAGFAELRVGVFQGDPQFVELATFEELLSGGGALVEGARKLRDFLFNIREFTLRKAGEEQLDSRAAHALRASIDVELRSEPRADAPLAIHAIIRNTGSAIWLPSPTLPGGVCVGVHLYAGHDLVKFDYHWEQLPGEGLRPGEVSTLDFSIPSPSPGNYVLEFDCVAQNVAWFATSGSATKRLAVEFR
jgi:2-polyprenyl-3-methyl-5-hydroxy-6-metoxy-1,4-benzoquinol methylase